jgi:hypothetical protein
MIVNSKLYFDGKLRNLSIFCHFFGSNQSI